MILEQSTQSAHVPPSARVNRPTSALAFTSVDTHHVAPRATWVPPTVFPELGLKRPEQYLGTRRAAAVITCAINAFAATQGILFGASFLAVEHVLVGNVAVSVAIIGINLGLLTGTGYLLARVLARGTHAQHLLLNTALLASGVAMAATVAWHLSVGFDVNFMLAALRVPAVIAGIVGSADFLVAHLMDLHKNRLFGVVAMLCPPFAAQDMPFRVYCERWYHDYYRQIDDALWFFGLSMLARAAADERPDLYALYSTILQSAEARREGDKFVSICFDHLAKIAPQMRSPAWELLRANAQNVVAMNQRGLRLPGAPPSGPHLPAAVMDPTFSVSPASAA